MTVTIQKELADRITARPARRTTARSASGFRANCDRRAGARAAAASLLAQAESDSAIIHIRFDPQRRAQIADLRSFHDCVRSLFFTAGKGCAGTIHIALRAVE